MVSYAELRYMMNEVAKGVVAYCVDVGRYREDSEDNNFGWARGKLEKEIDRVSDINTEMSTLIDSLTNDLNTGNRVALGLECPLYVPFRSNPRDLAKARKFETKSWSASPGATSMATGLVQSLYVLEEVRNDIDTGEVEPYFEPKRFRDSEGSSLLIWEAFVSGEDKPSEGIKHVRDAVAAVNGFLDAYEAGDLCVTDERVHSLIGSALLRTGWADKPDLLKKPCSFVRPSNFAGA